MLDFKKYLATNSCIVLKQFKNTNDRCICLVRRPDGSTAVWRLYDRPVLAYNALVSGKYSELPEVYRYTDTEQGGCLVEEEYIDGISLAELLETHSMDEYQTAAIAHRVCKALIILHHKNMVHRDIKPEHILITSNGRVVLIDLDAVSPRTSSKDRDTQLLGTVGYAAPEQYGFGHSDGRTDIFGVGVLMNILLTGKHPVQELTDSILRPVVEKCITINADQRYATVEELMSQLPDYVTQKCSLCGFTSPGGGCIFCGVHTEKAHLGRRTHLRLAAAALALLLVVGIGYLIWLIQHSGQGDHSVPEPSPGYTVQSPENTPASSPSAVMDRSDVAENPPTEPTPFPDASPTPSSVPPEVTPPQSVVSPEVSPTPPSEPSPVEPPKEEAPPKEEEPPPSQTPSVPVETLPDFSGERTYKITSFLYDLDGDGAEEEYYFGLMNQRAEFASKIIITTPYTEDGVSTQKFAPAVWTMNEEGILTPVSQFAAMLEQVEISFYQFRGNKTVPVVKEIDPLDSVWRGAMEISCGYGETGNWVAVARAVLNGTELMSHTNFFIRLASTIPNTAAQSILITDGLPLREPLAIPCSSIDQLLFGECEVYGCTAQYLDNDHVRFAVDYSGPVAQSLTIFDPPDGARFKYTDRSGTSGGRERLIFDLPGEQIQDLNAFTITFNCGNESRFLIVVDVAGL